MFKLTKIDCLGLQKIVYIFSIHNKHAFSLSFTFCCIMKSIPEETHNNILSLLDNGLSSHKIAAQLGVSRSTIDRIRAKSRSDIPKSRGGRPAKLKATDKRRLLRTITSGKADNAVQLTRELRDVSNIEVNAQTVRRALKEAGLKAATKKKKPQLLPRHICQWLDFATKYQHWTVEDWKRVVNL